MMTLALRFCAAAQDAGGEPLNEVNTRADCEKYVRGGR